MPESFYVCTQGDEGLLTMTFSAECVISGSDYTGMQQE